ncbi:hypothetical protein WA026_002644 [Henosepilachna vigintioctopunctata]|uniref:Transposase n=1 Tax=Henosepilachna vigintioctopunctata TaxID=420089 RepID=A0AAW1U1T2_9CUCU
MSAYPTYTCTDNSVPVGKGFGSTRKGVKKAALLGHPTPTIPLLSSCESTKGTVLNQNHSAMPQRTVEVETAYASRVNKSINANWFRRWHRYTRAAIVLQLERIGWHERSRLHDATV